MTKKRLTIADYQAANTKLVEERATLTKERDDALKAEKDSREFARTARKDIYAMLNGDNGHFRNEFSTTDDVSYTQIARRIGELVATERFFHEMKKEFFGEEIQISGTPSADYLGAGYSELKDRQTGRTLVHNLPKPHIHTIDCLPPQMREGVSRLAETITKDLNDEIKRRKTSRRNRSLLLKLAVIIPVSLAIGYFGAAAIF